MPAVRPSLSCYSVIPSSAHFLLVLPSPPPPCTPAGGHFLGFQSPGLCSADSAHGGLCAQTQTGWCPWQEGGVHPSWPSNDPGFLRLLCSSAFTGVKISSRSCLEIQRGKKLVLHLVKFTVSLSGTWQAHPSVDWTGWSSHNLDAAVCSVALRRLCFHANPVSY